MKRLLFFITALFLLVSVDGQILRYSNYVAPAEPEGGGGEMINNGTFDSSSSWTLDAGWTISDGVATYDDVSNLQELEQFAADMVTSLSASTAYTLTFDLTIEGVYTARIGIFSPNWTHTYKTGTAYLNGEIIINFTTPASITDDAGICILAYDASQAPFSIDNVSLTAD